MYSWIEGDEVGHEVEDAAPQRFVGQFPGNQRSTRLSHDDDVGVRSPGLSIVEEVVSPYRSGSLSCSSTFNRFGVSRTSGLHRRAAGCRRARYRHADRGLLGGAPQQRQHVTALRRVGYRLYYRQVLLARDGDQFRVWLPTAVPARAAGCDAAGCPGFARMASRMRSWRNRPASWAPGSAISISFLSGGQVPLHHVSRLPGRGPKHAKLGAPCPRQRHHFHHVPRGRRQGRQPGQAGGRPHPDSWPKASARPVRPSAVRSRSGSECPRVRRRSGKAAEGAAAVGDHVGSAATTSMGAPSGPPSNSA